MCTIKGVGNKSLNHMNSLPTLNSKVFPPFSQYCSYLTSVEVPKYGVLTAYEDELGQYLDNIKIWGIDVFSNSLAISFARILIISNKIRNFFRS